MRFQTKPECKNVLRKKNSLIEKPKYVFIGSTAKPSNHARQGLEQTITTGQSTSNIFSAFLNTTRSTENIFFCKLQYTSYTAAASLESHLFIRISKRGILGWLELILDRFFDQYRVVLN